VTPSSGFTIDDLDPSFFAYPFGDLESNGFQMIGIIARQRVNDFCRLSEGLGKFLSDDGHLKRESVEICAES